MRRATTAHSSRSARNLGKMRPLAVSPTPWPERPIRCSPAVTDLGDSTCSTRSTAPMSMPSSSEDVATRHGSSPALSCSSTTSRSSRASEPWWARAIGVVARRARSSRRREPLRRAAVVDEDDRRAVLAHLAGAAPGRSRARSTCASPPARRTGRGRGPSAPARPSTRPGTWILRSSGLRVPVSTIVHVRFGPTRKRPTSSSGFCVADSPIRCRSVPACSASRSSVSARCAPRLVCATAWISSTITCSAPSKIVARLAGEHQVERLGRGDEDVRRVADHVAPLLLRRVAGADRRPSRRRRSRAAARAGSSPRRRRAP